MSSPNAPIDTDDEYYLNNSVAIQEEMNRDIVSLNLEQSDEEDNGRTLSPGFEPSYSPQPGTSWEGHDEVPNYSLEPPQPQGESTVDDDVIFVAAYPAPDPPDPVRIRTLYELEDRSTRSKDPSCPHLFKAPRSP